MKYEYKDYPTVDKIRLGVTLTEDKKQEFLKQMLTESTKHNIQYWQKNSHKDKDHNWHKGTVYIGLGHPKNHNLLELEFNPNKVSKGWIEPGLILAIKFLGSSPNVIKFDIAKDYIHTKLQDLIIAESNGLPLSKIGDDTLYVGARQSTCIYNKDTELIEVQDQIYHSSVTRFEQRYYLNAYTPFQEILNNPPKAKIPILVKLAPGYLQQREFTKDKQEIKKCIKKLVNNISSVNDLDISLYKKKKVKETMLSHSIQTLTLSDENIKLALSNFYVEYNKIIQTKLFN